MKLIVVALFAFFAFTTAVHWSEDGQYRLVGEQPFRYISYGAAVPSSYGAAVPSSYRISYMPMPYRTAPTALRLREYDPFFYSYQQISQDK